MRHDAAELRLLSPLLDECTELPESEHEAWLSGLTGDAAPLRPVLRRMLARQASSELEQFLERPPEAAALEAGALAGDFKADDRIGPYRLLRPIGHGGMGEVWLATHSDGQLKRSVALKLPMLSVHRSVLVQRFERERDILAALIHPHIACLYDAGVAEDGQPYMALEYVEGKSITEAADDKALDALARVRLLRQVTDAVQYAHANLVIHRDLKPVNVLVTADGAAKLLDFGIAKLVEDEAGASGDSELTRLGGRALTLRYAAPELIAGGAVSTAVDIWALGVLLYELLTGLRPFGGDAKSDADDEEFSARHAIYRSYGAHLEGNRSATQAWYVQARAHAGRGLLDASPNTVFAVRSLAIIEIALGLPLEATQRLRTLRDRLQADKAGEPADVLSVMVELAAAERNAGRFRVALEQHDAARALCQISLNPNGTACVYNHFHRATLLLLLGLDELAMEVVPFLAPPRGLSEDGWGTRRLIQAYGVLAKNQQLDAHPDVVSRVIAAGNGSSVTGDNYQGQLAALVVQTRHHLREGRPRQAMALSTQAQSLIADRGVAENQFVLPAQALHGISLHMMGAQPAALQQLDRVHAQLVQALGAEHPRTQLASIIRARPLWAAASAGRPGADRPRAAGPARGHGRAGSDVREDPDPARRTGGGCARICAGHATHRVLHSSGVRMGRALSMGTWHPLGPAGCAMCCERAANTRLAN